VSDGDSTSSSEYSSTEADAVCFSAGLSGPFFSAGVTHAYLAADRQPPKVVAGISGGALSAAAMQRCYRELDSAKKEVTAGVLHPQQVEGRRWKWFRHYLQSLLHRPLDFVWHSIPDLPDFLTGLPTPKETALPRSEDGSPDPEWEDSEAQSRRSLRIMVQLGVWLASLGIRIRDIAWLAVRWVRFREDYPKLVIPGLRVNLIRLYTVACLLARAVYVVIQLIIHTCVHPRFIWEWQFQMKAAKPRSNIPFWLRRLPRPLLGWRPWLFSFFTVVAVGAYLVGRTAFVINHWHRAVAALPHWKVFWASLSRTGWPVEGHAVAIWFLALILGLAFSYARTKTPPASRTFWWDVAAGLAVIVPLALVVIDLAWQLRSGHWDLRIIWPRLSLISGLAAWAGGFFLGSAVLSIADWLVDALGTRRSLLHDFQLRLALYRLFEVDGRAPRLNDDNRDPMPAVLVVAPLQTLPSLRHPEDGSFPTQLWASSPRLAKSAITVVDALRACLSVSPLFEPVSLDHDTEGTGLEHWVDEAKLRESWPGFRRLDLVDGAVVRQNPLPALFSFLSNDRYDEVKNALEREAANGKAQIHLVLDVPVVRLERPSHPGSVATEARLPDIVHAGFSGRRLARRRDSQLEVLRTRFIGSLETAVREAGAHSDVASPLIADQIGPQHDFQPKNPLSPTEEEVLQRVSEGCRQTLGLIYRDRLNPGCETRCAEFLPTVAPGRFPIAGPTHFPGVAEVCRHCTQKLTPAPPPDFEVLPASFRDPRTHRPATERFQHLLQRDPDTGRPKPRIVFLASGGVFRGSFHIGMLAALAASNIKPDMIVGASVGSLMGAVLGEMYRRHSYEDALRMLGDLAMLFCHVDSKVAVTRTLKSAATDFGILGRRIGLSPNALRRLLLAGARHDPGMAATGAPPALIDAIAHLFLIPYRDTAEIAADFVGGKITGAITQFFRSVRKYTIPRLGIQEAVIGTALLETEIRNLLGKEVNGGNGQPFLPREQGIPAENRRGIAFFATTTNLIEEWTALLGADLKMMDQAYDFVAALLASSAFPAAFPPKRESEIYPGIGRRDTFFGDGGVFDNLPFVPALSVLSRLQKNHGEERGHDNWLQDTISRADHPDLFLVGALDAEQQPESGSFDGLRTIWNRASRLEQNEKIYGFQRASRRVHNQIDRLAGEVKKRKAGDLGDLEAALKPHRSFLEGVVNHGVLAVFPADNEEHLNGTFQFCSSVGMTRKRLQRSIAHGCFQTLLEIAKPNGKGSSVPLQRSLRALEESSRIPKIEVRGTAEDDEGRCPFFRSTARPYRDFGLDHGTGPSENMVCPFYLAGEQHKDQAAKQTDRAEQQRQNTTADELTAIHDACRSDKLHRKRIAEAVSQGNAVAKDP
jgi:predicted acylesterase/phospholipase RssA